MILRVVLDTNIFISGIFWRGNFCSQIIGAWREGRIVLVSSQEIVEEFIETVKNFKIQMSQEMIEEWKMMIVENSFMVLPTKKLEIVKNDPDDNKFFEAAIAANAHYIVSQDKKHVLSISEFRGIKTIHPQEFVKLL